MCLGTFWLHVALAVAVFTLVHVETKMYIILRRKQYCVLPKWKKNQSIYLKSENHNFHKPNTTSILSQLKGD